MSKLNLTRTVIEKLSAEPGRQILYRDSKLPGFGVCVGAKTRTYFVERKVNNKTRRFTVGRYPDMTPEKARVIARDTLAKMSQGVDVNQEKRAEASRMVTLNEAFEEFKTTRPLKPRTLSDYSGLLDSKFSDWKTKPIIDISRDMVSRRHLQIGEESGHAQANYAMRFLRALMNYCIGRYEDADGTPLLKDNPVLRLSQTRQWFRLERRRTIINNADLPKWFQAVQALGSETARDYLLFTVLTGLRRNEGLALRWEDVHFPNKSFTVSGTKNRTPLNLPLSDYLFEMLSRRKKTAGESRFIFPGQTQEEHYQEPKRAIENVIAASGVSFCIHDLRRVFITQAESLDISVYAVKRLVNHSTGGSDVTAGYVVHDVERLRTPMQKITDHILRLCGAKDSRKVIPLAQQQAKVCQ